MKILMSPVQERPDVGGVWCLSWGAPLVGAGPRSRRTANRQGENLTSNLNTLSKMDIRGWRIMPDEPNYAACRSPGKTKNGLLLRYVERIGGS